MAASSGRIASAGETSNHTSRSFSWLQVASRVRQALNFSLESEVTPSSPEALGEQNMSSTRQHDASSPMEERASSSEGSGSHSISLSTAHARPSSQRQAANIQQLEPDEAQEGSPAASAERHRLEAAGAIDLRVAHQPQAAEICFSAASPLDYWPCPCRILLSGLKNLSHILRCFSSSFLENIG